MDGFIPEQVEEIVTIYGIGQFIWSVAPFVISVFVTAYGLIKKNRSYILIGTGILVVGVAFAAWMFAISGEHGYGPLTVAKYLVITISAGVTFSVLLLFILSGAVLWLSGKDQKQKTYGLLITLFFVALTWVILHPFLQKTFGEDYLDGVHSAEGLSSG